MQAISTSDQSSVLLAGRRIILTPGDACGPFAMIGTSDQSSVVLAGQPVLLLCCAWQQHFASNVLSSGFVGSVLITAHDRRSTLYKGHSQVALNASNDLTLS